MGRIKWKTMGFAARVGSAQGGFTLMEVLTTVVIISVGIMSIVSIFPVAFNQAERAIEYGIADTLTENVKCMLKAQCLYMTGFSTCVEMNEHLYPGYYNPGYVEPPAGVPTTRPWHFPWFVPWSRQVGAQLYEVPSGATYEKYRYSAYLDKSTGCFMYRMNEALGASFCDVRHTFKIPAAMFDPNNPPPPDQPPFYGIPRYAVPFIKVDPDRTVRRPPVKTPYSWSVVFEPVDSPLSPGCRYRVQIAIWKNFNLDNGLAGGVLAQPDAVAPLAYFGAYSQKGTIEDRSYNIVIGIDVRHIKVGDYIAFLDPATMDGNGWWYRISGIVKTGVILNEPVRFIAPGDRIYGEPGVLDYPAPGATRLPYVVVSRKALIRLTEAEVIDINDL